MAYATGDIACCQGLSGVDESDQILNFTAERS